MLVDAHAHLDKYGAGEIDEVLRTIEARRILTLAVSVDLDSFAATEAIAGRSRLVVPCFGIHPEQAPGLVERLEEATEVANRTPMLGEIGLDHRFVTDPNQYESQRQVFEHFLELAGTQKKVVNLHTAGAERLVGDLLRHHRTERAIVHWYSGPLDVLGELIELGCYFTVGPELMRSGHIQEIARRIPDGRLLTETDNPGGLQWISGERGFPSLIDEVITTLAEVRGTKPTAIQETVELNTARLFADDPHLQDWAPLLDAP